MGGSKSFGLGKVAAEAEVDFLSEVFYESQEYQYLTRSDDFLFVAGRRGTGKSALFIKAAQFFEKQVKQAIVVQIIPEDLQSQKYRSILGKYVNVVTQDNYSICATVSKICWKVTILVQFLRLMKADRRFSSPRYEDSVTRVAGDFQEYLKLEAVELFLKLIEDAYASNSSDILSAPHYLAGKFNVSKLVSAVSKAFQFAALKGYLFVDGLDEGWEPDRVATTMSSGLGGCAVELKSKGSNIHCVLFIRDNMYRAMREFDGDFTKNVVPSALRLNWDEDSLYRFICIRIAKQRSLNFENNNKIWSRLVRDPNLRDRDGFRLCLKYTLFRPRDLLVLINGALIVANKAGREDLILQDIESSAREIANSRLTDLITEYHKVFIGLRGYTEMFRKCTVPMTYQDALEVIRQGVSISDFSTREASDFALMESPEQGFQCLYSVGFLGYVNGASQVVFCHDGSDSNKEVFKQDTKVYIHPCYHSALDVSMVEHEDGSLLNSIYDDYSVQKDDFPNITRKKQIGELVNEFPEIAIGRDGSRDFEDWGMRTIKVLFAGTMSNPSWRENHDLVTQRDIVVTNTERSTFFKRIKDDYGCRQVVFEIKNYNKLKREDFRQCLEYATGLYGRLTILVCRTPNLAPSDQERTWIKETYDGHKVEPPHFYTQCFNIVVN